MLFRTRGKVKISSLREGGNPSRRRAAVMAGVLASVTVVALGTATAASQDSGKPAAAAAHSAPAGDSARENWQPPADKKDGARASATAQEEAPNTTYLINEVTPGQFRGSWYQSHIEGINVT